MFSPLPGSHLGPPFLPLEALLFELFGVVLVPESRPPMQSALRVDFCTLSCCMLRHLLLLVLCMFSPLPGWHLGPPFQPLEPLLFELFDVILVPEITPSYAVCSAR